ncbi:MAG: twin-arginine translocase TatA/TatE family subunit, partial [Actinomycetota bacterium]
MGSEWIVIAVIAVAVIFGASKLPQFARNVGKAQGEFKKGLKEGATDEDGSQGTSAPQAAPPTSQQAAPPSPTSPAAQPPSEPAAPEVSRPADP